MSDEGRRPRAASSGGILRRTGRAWRALEPEQRTAAAGALALFVTMFLPWYSKTAVGVVKGAPVKVDDSLTAFQEFSFVEAAVLLVAVGILWMLFARGEGKAFHLPFGDGNVIFAAGLWVCALVFYRQFDKPSPGTVQGLATTVGVSWGIFVTFLTGLFIAFSGQRLRSARLAEPALPGAVAPSDEPAPRGRRRPRSDDGPGSVRADAWQAPDDRPRPGRDVSPTVVDRRPGPSFDETLVADVPEYPSGRAAEPQPQPPTDVTRQAPPADPPTARTRVARPDEDQLRLDDEAHTRPDGQLRFDDER